MDDLELEEWFNERKEELEQKVMEDLQVAKNRDAVLKRFDKDYKSLIAKFQKRQEQMYERNRELRRIQKPLLRLKSRIDELLSLLGDKLSAAKESVRRWFFNRKIKRIMNDKSDMFIK